jgi:hypothetical protein
MEEKHVTPPPYYGQQPPAAPGNDKVTLWGVLGIVFAFCCWPLGIVFSVLCLMETKKVGKPLTLAYVALGLSIVLGLVSILLSITGVIGGIMDGNSTT